MNDFLKAIHRNINNKGSGVKDFGPQYAKRCHTDFFWQWEHLIVNTKVEDFLVDPFKPTLPYFDNSHLCGECTGAGCKQCNGTGVTRFPLALVMNASKPPAIINQYARKFTFINPIAREPKFQRR